MKFFATSMYRLYSMPFSFSCLFSHFNWSKIASHAIFALFLFTFCWGLPSLLLHTCGIIVYFSFKLFQIVLFSANVSDWSVSKICIKYRKHENPSFSHTFNTPIFRMSKVLSDGSTQFKDIHFIFFHNFTWKVSKMLKKFFFID